MLFEIVVSDHLGAWGTAGKVFRPGIYITENMAIVEAAMNNGPYVTARRLDAVDEVVEEIVETTPEPEVEAPSEPEVVESAPEAELVDEISDEEEPAVEVQDEPVVTPVFDRHGVATVETFAPIGDPSGLAPLSKGELNTLDTSVFSCDFKDCDAPPFKTKAALRTHITRRHTEA